MELEVDWFNILPELLEEDIETIDAKAQEIGFKWWREWYQYSGIVGDSVGCDQCIHVYNIDDFLEDLPYLSIQWILFSSLMYLLILGIYYIIFKCKKFQNPLKYAFKKSRLWWIMVLILPVIVVIVFVIAGFFEI
jgi:hypothetical protein